jgi:hypothetical protein
MVSFFGHYIILHLKIRVSLFLILFPQGSLDQRSNKSLVTMSRKTNAKSPSPQRLKLSDSVHKGSHSVRHARVSRSWLIIYKLLVCSYRRRLHIAVVFITAGKMKASRLRRFVVAAHASVMRLWDCVEFFLFCFARRVLKANMGTSCDTFSTRALSLFGSLGLHKQWMWAQFLNEMTQSS